VERADYQYQSAKRMKCGTGLANRHGRPTAFAGAGFVPAIHAFGIRAREGMAVLKRGRANPKNLVN
jgi:hypothetical protein